MPRPAAAAPGRRVHREPHRPGLLPEVRGAQGRARSTRPRSCNEFYTLYESFTHRLPGNLRFRPIGVLCLGDRRRGRAAQPAAPRGHEADQGGRRLHLPARGRRHVLLPARARPEAVDRLPGVRQGALADDHLRAGAGRPTSRTSRTPSPAAATCNWRSPSPCSSGRISFRQAIQFTRQLQYEAQTIALNQTVSAFAHGNDTFGWRFTPRYQTPPEESNLRAVDEPACSAAGPGRTTGSITARSSPGMRELTAVVVMPSFVRGMRLDVVGRLVPAPRPRRAEAPHRPLDRARPPDQRGPRRPGRRLQVRPVPPRGRRAAPGPAPPARGDAAAPDPVREGPLREHPRRLRPVHPGRDGPGARALRLRGGRVPSTRREPNDIIVYGKHFSIYETAVVVGGQSPCLARGRRRSSTQRRQRQGRRPSSTTLTPLRDTEREPVPAPADGKTTDRRSRTPAATTSSAAR